MTDIEIAALTAAVTSLNQASASLSAYAQGQQTSLQAIQQLVTSMDSIAADLLGLVAPPAPALAWIPESGQAAAITTNTIQQVYGGPGPWDTGGGIAPICAAYSGGALVMGSKPHGVMCVAGTGDGDGYFNGKPHVDLNADQPAWVMPFGPSPHCDTVGEDTAHGEWSDGSPGVGHTYYNLTPLTPDLGGGPEGSLLMPWAAFYHTSDHNTGWAHKCDVTGTSLAAWTRASTGASGATGEAAFAMDFKRKRAIGCLVGPSAPESFFFQLDFSAGTGVGVPSTIGGEQQETMGKDASPSICPDFDLFCLYGTYDNGTPGIRAWDLTDANMASKVDLTFVGDPLPNQPGMGFAWCTTNHCWYLRSGAVGDEQKRWRIDKPASGVKTDPWAVRLDTISGVTIGGNTPNGVFGRYQEDAASKCMIIVTDVNHPVYADNISNDPPVIGGVAPPVAPTLAMSVSPSAITAGGNATLTWTSTNATSVTIDGARVALSGTMSVTPTATHTYAGSATGAGGSVTANAPVTVNPAGNGSSTNTIGGVSVSGLMTGTVADGVVKVFLDFDGGAVGEVVVTPSGNAWSCQLSAQYLTGTHVVRARANNTLTEVYFANAGPPDDFTFRVS